jgi:hypothetical protein
MNQLVPAIDAEETHRPAGVDYVLRRQFERISLLQGDMSVELQALEQLLHIALLLTYIEKVEAQHGIATWLRCTRHQRK